MIKVIKNIIFIFLIICVFITFQVSSAQAVIEQNLSWAGGNTYKLTPSDSTVTEKNYTIKAVNFPSPVVGRKTVNDTIVPDHPVTPFVTLELYWDIINNPDPIGTFTLGLNDQYITTDNDLKITLIYAPGSTSQNWVYEYYNPWATIKVQKTAAPNIRINIKLKDINEDSIDPGDSFNVQIKFKNIGDDYIKNIKYGINPDPSLLQNSMIPQNILKNNIDSLNKDEEKIIEFRLSVPASIEEKEYNINVNLKGYDIKNILYNWSASKKIKVRSPTHSIMLNKSTKSTFYIKDIVNVVLSITNRGPITINTLKISDPIPEKLLFIKDNVAYKNITEFSLNKYSLEPGESWTFSYNLKPLEPGVYVLPKFTINYIISGKEFNSTSKEVGFRVFGPKVILKKSVTNKGNDVIDVKVTAKNVGNGFTTVIIKDELPQNAVLVSGKIDLSASLDANAEKAMTYTIKIPQIKDMNSISWPPAKATYYLDDYRFNASSDEKEMVFSDEVPRSNSVTPKVTPPEIKEGQKMPVGTIPAKTPIQTPDKKFPIAGFRFYDLLSAILLIIIISILRKK